MSSGNLIQVGAGVGISMSDTAQTIPRGGRQGDTIVSELHGRYYEASYRERRFVGGNQAGATTTVGLATTHTGLVLSNPINSTVNLVIDKVGASFIVAFAAGAAIGLMTGYNATTNVTHTTPATPRNCKFGTGAAGIGLLDVSSTLPTAPVVTHIFGAGLTGAITTTPQIPGFMVDLEGSLILPPGAYCAIYTSTASGTASMIATFQWEEVPV